MSGHPEWAKEPGEDTPLMGSGGSLQDPVKPKVEEKGKENTKQQPPRPEVPVKKPKAKPPADWHKDEEAQQAPPAGTKRIKKPSRNPVLYMFHCLEFWAIVGCLCLLASQVLPFLLVPVKQLGVVQLVLRLYVALFCIMFILVEVEAPLPFLRSSNLLNAYFSRGFFYSFLALVCLQEAFSSLISDTVSHNQLGHVAWQPLFMQVSAWLVFGIGVCYMLLGVCCMKRVRDRLQQKYKDEMRLYNRAEEE